MSYSQKVHEEIYEWNIYVNMLDLSGLITLLKLFNRSTSKVNALLSEQLEN